MDATGDDETHTVVLMSASQVGKTEVELNAIGFHMAHDPSPILMIQPTLEMAEAFSKDRLAPMLRDTPTLSGKVAAVRARDSGNTLLHKNFPGGHITLAGANSAASLASRPIRVVLFDEVDRYPASAGTEGDPVSLALKRSTTFGNRKAILVSSPTIKGKSRIEAAYLESDQRKLWAKCPHCGTPQVLKFDRVVWQKDGEEGKERHRPETAHYQCAAEDCGTLWSDAERWQAVRDGEWRADAPFHGIAGFWLSELYSPWVRLEQTVRNYLASKDRPELHQTWINTAMAETWEERVGTGVIADDLARRREPFDPETPAGVLVITAGVDQQANRLEVEIVGWGEEEESWSVDYRVIHGDPSGPGPWAELDALLLSRWQGADRLIPVSAVCIDVGAGKAQRAYEFCRQRLGRRVWPIKGAAERFGRRGPVWPRKPTRGAKAGTAPFVVGTLSAKDVIADHLRTAQPGPSYAHFPDDRGEEWFAQLTAEHLVVRRVGSTTYTTWDAGTRRNEALDCRVYAYAALCGLRAMGYRLKRRAPQPAPEASEQQQGEAPPPQERQRALSPFAKFTGERRGSRYL